MDKLGLETIKVPECHAYLIIGHASKRDPVKWEFSESECAYGGFVGCWPASNNPEGECRWPNIPFHDDEIYDSGHLKNLAVGQSQSHSLFDEDFFDPDWEHDAQKIIDNTWSRTSLKHIQAELCGSMCCCKQITFVVTIKNKISDELKDSITKFNWTEGMTRKIYYKCNSKQK